MRKQVNFGQNEVCKFGKGTYNGIALNINVEAALVNVDLNKGDIDLSLIRVKAELHGRGSKPIEIAPTMDVDIWARAGNFAKGIFDTLVTSTSALKVLQTKGASQKEQSILPVVLPFFGVINVGSDEELVITVDAKTNALSSDINVNASNISCSLLECVGYEYGTPKIDLFVIEANKPNVSYNLGDNVTSLLFINTDKNGEVLTAQVIDNAKLSSDQLEYDDDYRELVAKRYHSFEDDGIAAERDQSFDLFPRGVAELDNVKLRLDLINSNVTSGRNVLFCCSYQTSPALVQLAAARQEKHEAIKARKIGFGGQMADATSAANRVSRAKAAVRQKH